MSVAIVDYGSGNLHSAAKAFERAARESGHDQPILVTSDPAAVASANRVVLPGVGAFADCRRGLDEIPGMIDALEQNVRQRGRPFFGICVGMQLMAERGREYQVTPGLGWIAGEVDRIEPTDPDLKIPHMGWNTLNMLKTHPLLADIPLGPDGLHAYFVHSYELKTAQRSDLVAQADYGGPEKKPAAGLEADRQFFEVGAVILFPAIDLKEGLAVRLEQGDMARATVFHRDPAAQAREFELQGFEYLHIVDLDGAFAGKPVNASAVERILETIAIPVQLGGGVRDMATIEAWLGKGVNRVIIGTAAVRNPSLVMDAAKNFPGRVAVGLDARDGKVAVQGWAELSELSALDIARRFEDAGVAAIIYTDIARDGLLKGLNLDATIALAEAISIPVIASGGLASIDDIKAMLEPRAKKLEGAIAGRALYDGRLDAAEALQLIRAARTA